MLPDRVCQGVLRLPVLQQVCRGDFDLRLGCQTALPKPVPGDRGGRFAFDDEEQSMGEQSRAVCNPMEDVTSGCTASGAGAAQTRVEGEGKSIDTDEGTPMRRPARRPASATAGCGRCSAWS